MIEPSFLKRSALGLCILLLVVGVMSVPAPAQVRGGGLTGRVTDPTGAVLPGVTVTVRHQATNAVRTAVTNDEGIFRIPNLPPGMYEVKFELPGFKVLVSSDNEVTVGQFTTVNATLEVGEIQEVVTVTGLAAAVNTEDSQPSSLITGEQILELPLNGRNVYALALVAPGVVPAMGTVAQTGGASSESFMAAGTRARGNNFTLDGASNTNDGISGLPTLTPSVDAVQEFRLIRNNFSAEYGTHSGSVVNVVTKSGTNELHGSVYEFHRNDALDAADVFAPYDEATGEKDKSPLKWNQFGFTLGGPIVEDKLFFFGGYEGFRERRGTTQVTIVETPEFRDYLFQNFPDSVAAKIMREIPALTPTREIQTVGDYAAQDLWCYFCDLSTWPQDLPVTGIIDASGSNPNDRDQFHIRIDWNISEKTQVFGRYDINDGEAKSLFFARPNGGGDLNPYRQQLLNMTFTHSFTPTLLNEFRFAYQYGREDFLVESPHIPMNYFTGGYGSIDNTVGGFLGEPQLFTRDSLQFQDIVSFNLGDHFFRVGIDVRTPKEDSDFGNTSRPLIIYSGLFDFALDSPYYISAGIDPRTGALSGTPREFQSTEVGWFIQDDWKVTPRFTLNLGVRWDYFGPTTEANDMLSNMRFPTGDTYFERIKFATVGPVPQLYEKDLNNFAPRIGFAWDIFGDASTALRGGYGVSYDKIFFNVGANSRFNPPFFGLAALSSVFFGDDTSNFPLLGDDPNDIFGGFLGKVVVEPLGIDEFGGIVGQRVSLRVLDPNIRDSYVHNLFLGIQRELPWEMTLEFNVQATYGKKLGFIGNPNRFTGDRLGWPNPFGEFEGDTGINRIHQSFLSFNLRQNRITSNYHGFNMQLSKRMTQGLSFQMAYTFGKSLDYNSDVFGAGGNNTGSDIFFTDPLNIALDYGPSNFDIRHRFVANFLWEIPVMRDQRGILGKIIGGWELTGTVPIQSGLPFSPYNTSRTADYNRDGTYNDRPNAPSFGHEIPGNPGTKEFIAGVFSADDFPTPELGTNGNLSKNAFRGPNFWTVDMGLFKNFRLPFSEESKLQFRAEVFNLFNRVNLYLPNVDLSSPLFGRSTATFAPREIQLALKIVF
ncbi:MAG: hypothetical protein Kow00109_18300 [Acidobacteriota bacterium]